MAIERRPHPDPLQERVHAMYDAFNSGGVAACREYWSEDFVWQSDPRFPGGGRHEGLETASAYMSGLVETFGRVQLWVQRLVVREDKVLALLISHNEARGLSLDSFWGHLWTVGPDGDMAAVVSYLDREAALAAIGEAEQDDEADAVAS